MPGKERPGQAGQTANADADAIVCLDTALRAVRMRRQKGQKQNKTGWMGYSSPIIDIVIRLDDLTTLLLFYSTLLFI